MGKTQTKVLNEEVHAPLVEVYQEIFQIVNNQGNYFIGCANNLIDPTPFASLEEAKAYIDKKPWRLIINVSCLLASLKETNKK